MVDTVAMGQGLPIAVEWQTVNTDPGTTGTSPGPVTFTAPQPGIYRYEAGTWEHEDSEAHG